MKKNILFIMADSEAYLRNEASRLYKEWGFNSSNVKTVEDWNPALVGNSVSLFGETSMVLLDLSDKNKLKKFADLISDKTTKQMFEKDNWAGPGLIITSIHAQGSKKIETLVEKSGGKVIRKAKPAEMKTLLLKRISLNSKTKEFLDYYVGDDYQILIGIVNQLEKLSKEEQSSMTPEDLLVRLPVKPGTIPPWDFINPLLDGNVKEAISLFERSLSGSHILVSMLLARKKLQLLYRLKVLQQAGIWKSQDQAAALGDRNGPNIWITAKTAQSIDLSTAEYLAKLSLVTEAALKGHSNTDPIVTFKNYIAAACLAIKYNKSFPLNIR